MKRRRLEREKIHLQQIRKNTRIAAFRISTIKVEKLRITPLEGIALIVGTLVGAGVLSLPYAASKVGLIPAMGILFGVMLLMIFTALIVLKLSVLNVKCPLLVKKHSPLTSIKVPIRILVISSK